MSKSLPRFNRAIAVSLITVSLIAIAANFTRADTVSASNSQKQEISKMIRFKPKRF
jgi:hypothetical protein